VPTARFVVSNGQFPVISSLNIASLSTADTVLAVYDPDGNWHCADDIDGPSNRDAMVELSPGLVGDYAVFVGTYAQNVSAESVLQVIGAQ